MFSISAGLALAPLFGELNEVLVKGNETLILQAAFEFDYEQLLFNFNFNGVGMVNKA